eukprot:318816_1
MEEIEHYTLSGLYVKAITNPSWIITFSVGCVLFLAIQLIGEKIFCHLSTINHVDQTISKQLFGTYVTSQIHAIILTIGSWMVISKYLNENISVLINANDDNFYVLYYRFASAITISYMVIGLPYELFLTPNNSIGTRIAYTLHHVLGIMSQTPIFILNPIFVLLSSLGFQIELSISKVTQV